MMTEETHTCTTVVFYLASTVLLMKGKLLIFFISQTPQCSPTHNNKHCIPWSPRLFTVSLHSNKTKKSYSAICTSARRRRLVEPCSEVQAEEEQQRGDEAEKEAAEVSLRGRAVACRKLD